MDPSDVNLREPDPAPHLERSIFFQNCSYPVSKPNAAHAHPSTSKVELKTNLQKAGLDDGLGLLPVSEGIADSQNRVNIQRVIKIEIDRGPDSSGLEGLRKPEIELVQALAVQRSRRDDRQRDGRDAAREWPAQRRGHLRRGGYVIREDMGPGETLKRRGDLRVNPGNGVRADDLRLDRKSVV